MPLNWNEIKERAIEFSKEWAGASNEEAETATEEIFIDIWRYSERARNTQSIEKKMIAMIALRRLIKPLQYAGQISMANINAPNEQGAGMDRISESS